MTPYRLLSLLAASGLLTALPSAQATSPPSSTLVTTEAWIQGGTSANANIDEVGTNNIQVKFGNSPYTTARKAYFQFDLAGVGADTNAAATLTLSFVNSYKQRVQLWGLNQAYPEFTADITWNTAKANDTASNLLLTNGPSTATPIGTNVMVPVEGTAPFTFTIPRLGDFLHGDKVTLALVGIQDPANNSLSLRIARTSATLAYQLFTGNIPPTISTIPDQTTRPEVPVENIPFTVGDAESLPDDLAVTGTSSDQTIVSDFNIVFGSAAGSNRTVSLFPELYAVGTTRISLTVTDGGGKSTTTSFLFTVLPANTAPVISAVASSAAVAGSTSAPIAFVVGDAESPAAELLLSATSSDPAILPIEGIQFGGSGSNRTVTLASAPATNGVLSVSLPVTDGSLTNTNVFPVMVLPAANVVFYDRFDYPDGELFQVSGNYWFPRAFGTTKLRVQGQQALIRSSSNADSGLAPLAGAPWPVGRRTLFYLTFSAMWTNLPGDSGAIVHLNDGTTGTGGLIARVATLTNNVTPGFFRLRVANGGTPYTEFPRDLTTNVTYRIAVRYDVDAATSTLWIDADSELGEAVAATDALSPVPVVNVGFRQNTQMGTALIDDLKVEVATRPAIAGISRSGNVVQIDFAGGAGDLPATYGVAGSAEVGGAYTPATASISELAPGVFRATIQASADRGFFRIVRQPHGFL